MGTIKGVVVTPLKQFHNEMGSVLHMLRQDSPNFIQFGEIYFSSVNSNIIKGWKKHLQMIQNFAVPIGNIQLVIYDDREDSFSKGTYQEIAIGGEDHYCLVQIPAGVWYSFKGLSSLPALIANCTTLPYDPAEMITAPLDCAEIPYQWSQRPRESHFCDVRNLELFE